MSQQCIEAVVIKTKTPDGETIQVFEKGGGIILEQNTDERKEIAITAMKFMWELAHNPNHQLKINTIDDCIKMYEKSIYA